MPSQSPLSRTFNSEFTRAIKMRVGNQSSWPALPVDWSGHSAPVWSVIYLPNGSRVVTGSPDKTIRIWDVESGAIVGEPLTGHDEGVTSVAYSPDGQYIISGSFDRTIRIWDAETGAPVGDPLEGHTDCNKTGRWPALFLTLSLTLWRSLHYIILLYITLGRSFITLLYSTLPLGGLFITLHYSTLLGTLFYSLLYICALYGGRW